MNRSRIRYPRALPTGGTIGVTAPSSGVEEKHRPRFELVKKQFSELGYSVVEGKCLHGDTKHVSAPAPERAADLVSLWEDDKVDAIVPPWGGELLIDMLAHLDFERLARSPQSKWILGYSDTSTLLFALTTKTNIATAHGSNFMDLLQNQVNQVTRTTLDALSAQPGSTFRQRSFPRYQVKSIQYEVDPSAPFNLTENVEWKSLRKNSSLRIGGRLIGGCLDTLMHLVGTPYGELPRFVREMSDDGIILYLENCEQSPTALARALWNMRLAGWFDGLAGVVFGRSAAPDVTGPEALSYVEAIESVLGSLELPVILDADIGHRPPQFLIVNGAIGEFVLDSGHGSLTQTLV